jgi:hypothetical protein
MAAPSTLHYTVAVLFSRLPIRRTLPILVTVVSASAWADEGGTTPTVSGSTGLYRASVADGGNSRSIYTAVYASLVRSSNLLVSGDVDTRWDVTAAAAFFPIPGLQLFGALRGLDNVDEQSQTSAPASVLHRVTGSATLGTKGVLPLGTRLVTGIEVGVAMPFVDSIFQSTSEWITLLWSVRLPAFRMVIPRVHINAGIYKDNSLNEVNFTGLSAADRTTVMFGDDMGRTRVRLALGFDLTLPALLSSIGSFPFAEYHLDVVTASPLTALSDQTPSNRDQQWLTLGVRSCIRARILVSVGLDIAVQPVGFAYGPPLPPYDGVIGVSTAF